MEEDDRPTESHRRSQDNDLSTSTVTSARWLTSKANKAWRWLVFFLGDIKRLDAFPWVTWAHHHYLVSYEEILPALPLIQYGDIGLHRGKGYLSNLFIPGFMKHAWVHVQDGVESPEIVEALSEGVVKRSGLYPMHSDYTIILTPRNTVEITDDQRKTACAKANQIVGEPYDDKFEFNIEEELMHYQGTEVDAARRGLEIGQEQLRRYHIAFSCTEVAAYAWWHRREALGIVRKQYRGSR